MIHFLSDGSHLQKVIEFVIDFLKHFPLDVC